MSNDIVADTLARLKNAVLRKKESVVVRNSKLVRGVLEILKTEKFINDFEMTEDDMINVTLSYLENGEPVALTFERYSKPGQRMYVSANEIIPVMNGRGISVISTSQGLMTGAMAKSKGIGGEYICKIW